MGFGGDAQPELRIARLCSRYAHVHEHRRSLESIYARLVGGLRHLSSGIADLVIQCSGLSPVYTAYRRRAFDRLRQHRMGIYAVHRLEYSQHGKSS